MSNMTTSTKITRGITSISPNIRRIEVIYLKKWLIWAGSLMLVLSLAANVYQYKQYNKTRQYVQVSIMSAAALLNTAATMQIMTNVPNNSTQVRGMTVAQAASKLESVAPFLDDLGVHHMEGVAQVLTGDSFPLMFPNRMGNLDTNQMLKLVRYSSTQLNACFPNNKLDFSKLQTAINNIYQEIPSQYRQSYYNE